jgi:hypothetical protein
MVPAPVERSEVTGSSATIAEFRSTDSLRHAPKVTTTASDRFFAQ